MGWQGESHIFVSTLTSTTASNDASCSQYNIWANEAWANLGSTEKGAATSKTNFVFVMPPEATGCAIGRGHLCSSGCTTNINGAFPKVWMHYNYRAREVRNPDPLVPLVLACMHACM